MPSHDFWWPHPYHVRRCLTYNVRCFVVILDPLPTLKLDNINGCSPSKSKFFPSLCLLTDYGHPGRKYSSLHGREFNPNPQFLDTAKAYFVFHIGSIFKISLIYAFISCPKSVCLLVSFVFMDLWSCHASSMPLSFDLYAETYPRQADVQIQEG